MDSVIINIIINSKLSDNFKKSLILLLQNYQDKNYGYICVGDAYLLIEDLLALEVDLKNSDFDLEIYMAFTYHYAKRFCLKDILDEKNNNKIIVWEKIYATLIKNVLLSSSNRKYFLELENPQTDIAEYLKKLSLLIEELINYIAEEKSYLVLKKYQELINLCNYYGLDSSLLEKGNEEKLKLALEKKYSIYSHLRNPLMYRKQVNKRHLSSENAFKPDNFVYIETPDTFSYMVQKLIHLLMKDYYKQTKYIVRPYSRDINLYYLDELVIVAYRYDNVPNMALKKWQITLTWEDRDFWAKIFHPNINFVEGESINYFIEDLNEVYQVVPLAFKNKFFNSLGDNVIFVPEKHLDEALYKIGINNNSFLEKLEKAGLNLDNLTDKLMTSDNQFYFKDPALVDELEVENLENHKYLDLIKSKKSKSRKKSIASIIALSNKYPKKPEPTKKKNHSVQKKLSYYPKGPTRLPYRDD